MPNSLEQQVKDIVAREIQNVKKELMQETGFLRGPRNLIPFLDIFGLVETVDTAPAGKPKSVSEQLKIYKSGTTYRLYWYDSVNDEWRYATGT